MTPGIAALDLRHGRRARMSVATVRLPGGETAIRGVEDHGRAAAVPPHDPERRVALLVRQFRAPLLYAAGEAETPELPAGRLEGDDPAACARREAMEEAGFRLGKPEPALVAWTMPARGGLASEREGDHRRRGAADRTRRHGGRGDAEGTQALRAGADAPAAAPGAVRRALSRRPRQRR